MKLKAATVIESLVAMVILVAVLAIGIMIYSNVLESDSQRAKLRAMLTLDKLAWKIQAEKKYIDSDLTERDMDISVKFVENSDGSGLTVFSMAAYNSEGKLLAERRELIFTGE